MQHRTCVGCGTEFKVPPHGQHAKYCGRACRDAAHNARRKPQHEQRLCQHCGQHFTPSNANQLYCPPTEADRQSKGQARSRCARAATNNAYRSTTEAATCKHCGMSFSRTRGCTANVYCSDACHHLSKQRRHTTPSGPTGRRLARLTLTTEPTRQDRSSYKRTLKLDPCSYCGTTEQGGIDHVEPSARSGSDDWTNWTGCCQRCNAIKQDMPLLAALQWIPISRAYHDARRTLFAQAGQR